MQLLEAAAPRLCNSKRKLQLETCTHLGPHLHAAPHRLEDGLGLLMDLLLQMGTCKKGTRLESVPLELHYTILHCGALAVGGDFSRGCSDTRSH